MSTVYMLYIHTVISLFVIYIGVKIMTQTNCNRRVECAFIAVAAGIIAGIVAAIAQFTAIITLTPVFYIVAFGVAVLLLAILLALAPKLCEANQRNYCASNLKLLTTGILGTIFTSVILLAVGFVATSVLGAIFVGLLAAFFTLMVVSVVCTANCTAESCLYN